MSCNIKFGVFQCRHLLSLWLYYPDNHRFCIIVIYKFCIPYLHAPFFIYLMYHGFNILNKDLFFLPTVMITWLLRKRLFGFSWLLALAWESTSLNWGGAVVFPHLYELTEGKCHYQSFREPLVCPHGTIWCVRAAGHCSTSHRNFLLYRRKSYPAARVGATSVQFLLKRDRTDGRRRWNEEQYI